MSASDCEARADEWSVKTLHRLSLILIVAVASLVALPAASAQVLFEPGTATAATVPGDHTAAAVRILMVEQVQNWAALINEQLYEHYENAYANWKRNRGLASEFEQPIPPLLWEHYAERTEPQWSVGVRQTDQRAPPIVEDLPPAPKITVCVGEKIPRAATWYAVCAGDNAPPGTAGSAPDGVPVVKIIIPFVGSSVTSVYASQ